MAKMVFSGLVMLWRLAVCPTRTSPPSVKATIEGVVRAPSAFSITLGLLPSMTVTQELVVPRSIPIALAMTKLLFQRRSCADSRCDRGCARMQPTTPLRIRHAPGGGTCSAREERPGHVPPAAGSGGFLNLDFLGFAAGRLRNRDFQNAIRHGRLNFRWIDACRQLEHS